MNERHDVVVIGAGLGGLLAASRLRAAGRQVVVLEQSAHPGGLGRSTDLGGASVNLGPHALYRSGRAVAVLKELGVTLEGFVPAQGVFFEGEGEFFEGPTSPLGLLTLPWLTWRERVELAWSMREVLAGSKTEGTLEAWLARRKSPRVRGFLAALTRVTTYTNAPGDISASAVLRQVRAGLDGVIYLDGGWQHLVDSLAARVDVRCGVRVSALEGTSLQTADGRCFEANDVVLAIPLAAVSKLVPREPALAERVERLQPVRAACLDLVLKSLPRPERRVVLGLEEPSYFSVHSRPDATGPVKVHVAWYLTSNETTSAREQEEKLERFLDRVQPGWRDVVQARRYFPHMRVMEDLPGRAPIQLDEPLHLVSGVGGFLLDAIATSTDALVTPKARAASR